MAQWEYCQIVLFARAITEEEIDQLQRDGFSGEFVTEAHPMGGTPTIARNGWLRFLSEPRGTEKQFTDLGSVITQLGRDGWELVSHSSHHDLTTLFFKRLLAD